MLFAFNMR